MEHTSGEWKKEVWKAIRRIFVESLIQASSQFIGSKTKKSLEKADQAIAERMKKKGKEEAEAEGCPKPGKKRRKKPCPPAEVAPVEAPEAPENATEVEEALEPEAPTEG